MQHMSRAQRVLAMYLLWKLSKPRVIQQITKLSAGGGPTSISGLATKDHHLLDGLLDDDHTQYFHTNGIDPMTGDLDFGAHSLLTTNLELTELDSNYLVIYTRGTTTRKGLAVSTLHAQGFLAGATTFIFPTAHKTYAKIYFQGWNGVGLTTAAILNAASGAGNVNFEIPQAGDIIPATHDTYDLGDVVKYWRKSYIYDMYADGLHEIQTGFGVYCYDDFWIADGKKLLFSSWGDTNLYRASANVLKTDDLLDAVLGFQVNGVAGVDGSFTTVDGKTVTVTKGIITSIV